ncbi:hypothetical protein, partial [Escherichia coli]|uniref:hypothetical protein n=1 Tax=Escherichia coli TaxID=562 RepID=UPI003F487ED6
SSAKDNGESSHSNHPEEVVPKKNNEKKEKAQISRKRKDEAAETNQLEIFQAKIMDSVRGVVREEMKKSRKNKEKNGGPALA